MRVLLAGVNSYIGARLVPFLVLKGHEVVCLVRDKKYFQKFTNYAGKVTLISGDLLRPQSMEPIPKDIDAAYYLINTFTQTSGFAGLEALSAKHFIEAVSSTGCQQVITISGINNQANEAALSRLNVEDILSNSHIPLTIFQTAMIIGPGSIALELLNALTEKTPVIIAQSWIRARSQPINIDDVLTYLEACLLNGLTYGREFDIGGPEVLAFKQLLFIYIATFKKLKPNMVTVPFLTTRMSSYLLNVLTPVSYPMAKNIVENLQYDNICRDDEIRDIIPATLTTFKRSIRQLHDTEISMPHTILKS